MPKSRLFILLVLCLPLAVAGQDSQTAVTMNLYYKNVAVKELNAPCYKALKDEYRIGIHWTKIDEITEQHLTHNKSEFTRIKTIIGKKQLRNAKKRYKACAKNMLRGLSIFGF